MNISSKETSSPAQHIHDDSPVTKGQSKLPLKIGFVSSLFYFTTAGSCPCCGAPMTTCGIGLLTAGMFGLFTFLYPR
ncbi:hypothetical protein ACFL6L_02775 [candidate division KSB1 bacterium]